MNQLWYDKLNNAAMSNLVLIVDDQPAILTTLAGVLSDEGYLTACADTNSACHSARSRSHRVGARASAG